MRFLSVSSGSSDNPDLALVAAVQNQMSLSCIFMTAPGGPKVRCRASGRADATLVSKLLLTVESRTPFDVELRELTTRGGPAHPVLFTDVGRIFESIVVNEDVRRNMLNNSARLAQYCQAFVFRLEKLYRERVPR